MKVIVLPSWYYTKKGSSVGTPFKEQTQALQKGGVEVAVFYADLDLRDLGKKWKNISPKKSFAIEEGIPTFRLQGIFPPKRKAFIFQKWAERYFLLYEDYLKRYGKADLIHARSYFGGYAAYLLSQKYDLPYIVSEHSSAFAEDKIKNWMIPFIQKSYDHAKARVAVSHGLKERMKTYTSKEIKVIPNFINTDFFKPTETKKENKIFTFFTLGGFVPEKRIDLLLQAFRKLLNNNNQNFQLNIGGWGEEEKKLKQIAIQLDLDQHVNFLGELSRGEVLREMQHANTFVLPSEYETFGIVLIEALATGTPTVAARHDGAKDIINDDNGVLFQINDVESLYLSLQNMVDKFEQFDAEVIRDFAVENFSDRVGVGRYLDLKASVLRHR